MILKKKKKKKDFSDVVVKEITEFQTEVTPE